MPTSYHKFIVVIAMRLYISLGLADDNSQHVSALEVKTVLASEVERYDDTASQPGNSTQATAGLS